jgi:hypothetical protein
MVTVTTKITDMDTERIDAMKKINIALCAIALTFAFACNKNATQNQQSTDSGTSVSSSQQTTTLSPEELGTLGAKIKKHPADAQKLLSDKGLTEQQFEQAVRKVAESPSDSKRYADAYKKAS